MSASALQAIELPKSIPQRFPCAPRLRSLRTQRRRPRRKRQRSGSERRKAYATPRGSDSTQAEAQRQKPKSCTSPSANARDRADAGPIIFSQARPAARRAPMPRRAGRAPRRSPGRAASRGPRARPHAPRWAAPPGCHRRLRRPGPRTPRPASGRRAPAPAGR